MTGLKHDLGPAGANVARTVAELRKRQGLTYAALSRELAAIGRPIPPLGLRRIEAGARRVDADDLMALVTVLGLGLFLGRRPS